MNDSSLGKGPLSNALMLSSRKAFLSVFTSSPTIECKYPSLCSPRGKVGCGEVSEHLGNGSLLLCTGRGGFQAASDSPALTRYSDQYSDEAKSHNKLNIFKKLSNVCVMIRM